jgi:hypothetical protein
LVLVSLLLLLLLVLLLLPPSPPLLLTAATVTATTVTTTTTALLLCIICFNVLYLSIVITETVGRNANETLDHCDGRQWNVWEGKE